MGITKIGRMLIEQEIALVEDRLGDPDLGDDEREELNDQLMELQAELAGD
jgi:hypothetical protein